MMVSVAPLVMTGGGVSPGSLSTKIKCWNRFKLMSDETEGRSEAGPGS